MNKKTQIQIAKQAGITQGHLSKVLSGSANPTVSTLIRISDAMGIKIGTLIKRIETTKRLRDHGQVAA